jgi:hypothetical protein
MRQKPTQISYQLVPIDPTAKMKTAAIDVEVYSDLSAGLGPLTWCEVEAIYKAMLAAAKEQP